MILGERAYHGRVFGDLNQKGEENPILVDLYNASETAISPSFPITRRGTNFSTNDKRDFKESFSVFLSLQSLEAWTFYAVSYQGSKAVGSILVAV